MDYQNIIVTTDQQVGIITLNRPQALNALSTPLMQELSCALAGFEADDTIGAIIITGSEKAFAAGADIKEMQEKSFVDCYREDFITRDWEAISHCRKPIIAVVSGFALGGGCELAMMCDFILAGENAKFGQPEITLGIIPGAGGTQRLTHLVGKSKAMELCLTGRMIEASEAERIGLVARVFPTESLQEEARAIAQKIASQARIATLMIKEAITTAPNVPLSQGLRFERRLFHSLFATEDQKEGMQAFLEKRKPVFQNR